MGLLASILTDGHQGPIRTDGNDLPLGGAESHAHHSARQRLHHRERNACKHAPVSSAKVLGMRCDATQALLAARARRQNVTCRGARCCCRAQPTASPAAARGRTQRAIPQGDGSMAQPQAQRGPVVRLAHGAEGAREAPRRCRAQPHRYTPLMDCCRVELWATGWGCRVLAACGAAVGQHAGRPPYPREHCLLALLPGWTTAAAWRPPAATRTCHGRPVECTRSHGPSCCRCRDVSRCGELHGMFLHSHCSPTHRFGWFKRCHTGAPLPRDLDILCMQSTSNRICVVMRNVSSRLSGEAQSWDREATPAFTVHLLREATGCIP
jgi:hypothetical protein